MLNCVIDDLDCGKLNLVSLDVRKTKALCDGVNRHAGRPHLIEPAADRNQHVKVGGHSALAEDAFHRLVSRTVDREHSIHSGHSKE